MFLQSSVNPHPVGLSQDAYPPPIVPERPGAGLRLEAAWRSTEAGSDGQAGGAVLASRWLDPSSSWRRTETTTPADRHVLAIALRGTRIRLSAGQRKIFDGVMPAGTVQLSSPGEALVAEFETPCDFIHLQLPRRFVERDGIGARINDPEGRVLRDPLAVHLARSLADAPHAPEPLYTECIARTLLLRLAAHRAPPAPACPLPKWRLKRVQDHLEANLSDPITLSDLAQAAGLSRSYFAAQFRATTGSRPHDYIVGQRIECAKDMLARDDTPLVEIALAVGFQTQAHFSTVFKRCTGTTPGRWRDAHLLRD